MGGNPPENSKNHKFSVFAYHNYYERITVGAWSYFVVNKKGLSDYNENRKYISFGYILCK